MKRFLLVSLCIILTLVGTSCTDRHQDNENLEKIDKLENEIGKLNDQIDILNKDIDSYVSREENFAEERQFYLNFISDLIEPMSDEYLTQIAQEQWTYQVLINEEPIPSDGIVEIKSNRFDLKVSEEQNPYRVLPVEIHERGKISKDLFSNHINFPNIKPSNTTGSEEEKMTSATYSFENLTDTVINLKISDELKDRINLDTNVITIKPNSD